jgi:membrane protein
MRSLNHLGRLTNRFIQFFYHLNGTVLLEVTRRSGQHRLHGLSAEIAYSAIFALFPAILTVLTAIGLLNIPDSSFRYLIRQMDEIVPQEAMTLIQEFLRQLRIDNQGLFSLSFVASIWVSSNVLSATMTALDQIYRIPSFKTRPFWRAKLMAIVLSLGTLLLLILALLMIFISEIGLRLIASHSGMTGQGLLWVGSWLSLPIAFAIVIVSLSFIYRHGPSVWRKGTPIFPGAVLAALLWGLLSGLLRLYVSHFGDYNQVYGAIGAVIILLLWLYLSAFSMLLGCQLNVVVGEAMHRQ